MSSKNILPLAVSPLEISPSRREFIKSLGLTSLALSIGWSDILNAKAAETRKPWPVQRFNDLWLTRDDEEARLDLRALEGYKKACWMLRDISAGNIVRPVHPWLLHSAAMTQAILKRLGINAPLEVVSGLRMPSTNAKAFGAKHSLHLPDARQRFYAMDIRAEGVTPHSLGRIISFVGQGGVGIYPKRNLVHMDVGAPRAWVR